jgi:hypothetical protein
MRHAAPTDEAWAAWARRPALLLLLVGLVGLAGAGAWWALERHYRAGAVVEGRVVAVERFGRGPDTVVVDRPRADSSPVRFRQRAIAPPQEPGDVVDVSVRDGRSRVVGLAPVGPLVALGLGLCAVSVGVVQLVWVGAVRSRVS